VHWSAPLQYALSDSFALNQMIEELLKFSLLERFSETRTLKTLRIHRLIQVVQMDRIEPAEQRLLAERVVQAVNEVFPENPCDINTWPQCLRYLDQVKVCAALIDEHMFLLVEGADVLNRANIYFNEHALGTIAEPLLTRALAIREQCLGETHSETAACLNNLAVLYKSRGTYAEAESLFQQALTIRERMLEPAHAQTAVSASNLASLYGDQGRYEEAQRLSQRALAIWEHLGPAHPEIALGLNNLASLYESQGRSAEAEPLYRRSLALREQHLGPAHSETTSSLNNLAALHIYRANMRRLHHSCGEPWRFLPPLWVGRIPIHRG